MKSAFINSFITLIVSLISYGSELALSQDGRTSSAVASAVLLRGSKTLGFKID